MGDFFASHVVRMTMDRYEIWWNLDTLSQAESVLINVRCPDFRGYNVHKHGIWGSKSCGVY